MIDEILVALGMTILGYSFYRSVRMVAEIKNHDISSFWRLSVKFATALVLIIFFFLSIVFFKFASLSAEGLDFFKIQISSAFLVGALFVTFIVKINSVGARSIGKRIENLKKEYGDAFKEREELEKRVEKVEEELESMKKLTKPAERELKTAEMKKEMKNLREELKKKE